MFSRSGDEHFNQLKSEFNRLLSQDNLHCQINRLNTIINVWVIDSILLLNRKLWYDPCEAKVFKTFYFYLILKPIQPPSWFGEFIVFFTQYSECCSSKYCVQKTIVQNIFFPTFHAQNYYHVLWKAFIIWCIKLNQFKKNLVITKIIKFKYVIL